MNNETRSCKNCAHWWNIAEDMTYGQCDNDTSKIWVEIDGYDYTIPKIYTSSDHYCSIWEAKR